MCKKLGQKYQSYNLALTCTYLNNWIAVLCPQIDATSGTFNPFSNILDIASCFRSWEVKFNQNNQTPTPSTQLLNPHPCSMDYGQWAEHPLTIDQCWLRKGCSNLRPWSVDHDQTLHYSSPMASSFCHSFWIYLLCVEHNFILIKLCNNFVIFLKYSRNINC